MGSGSWPRATVSPSYVPDRGHAVWLDFHPQSGHEQAGHRPALVLSPQNYNEQSGLALVCPITTRSKGYPFEIVLPDGLGVGGVVLVLRLWASVVRGWRLRSFAARHDVAGGMLATANRIADRGD